jgi:hypothetical protein
MTSRIPMVLLSSGTTILLPDFSHILFECCIRQCEADALGGLRPTPCNRKSVLAEFDDAFFLFCSFCWPVAFSDGPMFARRRRWAPGWAFNRDFDETSHAQEGARSVPPPVGPQDTGGPTTKPASGVRIAFVTRYTGMLPVAAAKDCDGHRRWHGVGCVHVG